MRINTTCTDQVFADSAGSVCPRRCDRSSPRDAVDRRTAGPVGGPRRLRERGKSPLQLARAVLLAIAVAPVVVSVGIPPGAGGAEPARGHNCGTAWTGWVGVPNPDVNPCPKGCERGEVALPLRKRIRHYGGIRQMERRLKTLFHIGCFERMEDAVLRLNANSLSAGVSE